MEIRNTLLEGVYDVANFIESSFGNVSRRQLELLASLSNFVEFFVVFFANNPHSEKTLLLPCTVKSVACLRRKRNCPFGTSGLGKPPSPDITDYETVLPPSVYSQG